MLLILSCRRVEPRHFYGELRYIKECFIIIIIIIIIVSAVGVGWAGVGGGERTATGQRLLSVWCVFSTVLPGQHKELLVPSCTGAW